MKGEKLLKIMYDCKNMNLSFEEFILIARMEELEARLYP